MSKEMILLTSSLPVPDIILGHHLLKFHKHRIASLDTLCILVQQQVHFQEVPDGHALAHVYRYLKQ